MAASAVSAPTVSTPTAGAPSVATSTDLRRLYVEAEARATRLRALLETSRLLATARGDGLDAALAAAAERASLLAGHRTARVARAGEALPADAHVVPLVAPGTGEPMAERLVVADPVRPGAALPQEDAEAVALIAQLMAAALAAHRREARLAELLDQLLAAQERERAHVARELHDGVAQLATAALRRIELAADGAGGADAARAAELTRELVAELRRIIAGMRPTALDDLGLAAAVGQLAQALQDAGCAVRVALAELPPLPASLESGLFRVAQESLANVRRHAAPCAVDVTLALEPAAGARPAALTLRVRDDGPGFLPHAAPGGAPNNPPNDAARGAGGNEHFGLAFMAERVRALGGRLGVESRPGGGCAVTATVPLP